MAVSAARDFSVPAEKPQSRMGIAPPVLFREHQLSRPAWQPRDYVQIHQEVLTLGGQYVTRKVGWLDTGMASSNGVWFDPADAVT